MFQICSSLAKAYILSWTLFIIRTNREQFIKCLDRIQDDVELSAGASCINDFWGMAKQKSIQPKKSVQKQKSLVKRSVPTGNDELGEEPLHTKQLSKAPELISPDGPSFPKSAVKTIANSFTGLIRAFHGKDNNTATKGSWKGSYIALQEVIL